MSSSVACGRSHFHDIYIEHTALGKVRQPCRTRESKLVAIEIGPLSNRSSESLGTIQVYSKKKLVGRTEIFLAPKYTSIV